MCEPAEQRLVNKAPDPLFNNVTHGTPNNVGSICCYGESEGNQLLLTSETTFVPGKWGDPGTRVWWTSTCWKSQLLLLMWLAGLDQKVGGAESRNWWGHTPLTRACCSSNSSFLQELSVVFSFLEVSANLPWASIRRSCMSASFAKESFVTWRKRREGGRRGKGLWQYPHLKTLCNTNICMLRVSDAIWGTIFYIIQ